MVLESIIKPKLARKHPIVIFLITILIASVSLWLSYLAFPTSASILALAFLTIALMPLIHRIFIEEEEAEIMFKSSSTSFIGRHFGLIKIYSFFFIGLIIAYSFWYVALPENARHMVFEEQENTLEKIDVLRTQITGKITVKSNCQKNFECIFETIFFNNLIVLILAIIFSFMYGAGALFLIGWNASIIAVVIGRDALMLIENYLNFGFLAVITAFLHSLYNSIGLLPHGLPEVLGYFIGAIAGGIISVAIMKKKISENELKIISKDVIFLIVIAIALLFIGALIETVLIMQS
jgi:hypothetical protein